MARHALAAGTRFGEFEILRVLGVGGYGIVYLARDHALERHVALKEYMPASLAARGVGVQVAVCCPSLAHAYAFGLNSFVNEARLLARFDHPSLVKVHRFWEDNGTAYMVMPYLEGIMLNDVRRAMSSPPDEDWIRRLVDPILSALELLHRESVYHRDIAPENILLPTEGPPVLLDFGAARHSMGDTQSFTTMLRLDYAPIEQFAGVNQRHQGAWTDLYALAAVMHFLIFGRPPAPAIERAVEGDDADSFADRNAPGMSTQLLEAMAWALAVWPSRRPRSAKALRDALEGRVAVPASARRRAAAPLALALPPASDAPSPKARGYGVPREIWPVPFEVTRVDWTYLPGLRRRLPAMPATRTLDARSSPPASTSLPPTSSSPRSQARAPVRKSTPWHVSLALALLAFFLVGAVIAYWTPDSQRDAVVAAGDDLVGPVALDPPAQAKSSEPLATMAGLVAAPAIAAAVPARPGPSVVSPPNRRARTAARGPSSARAATLQSSARARPHISASARRAALRAGKVARAPAKRGLSTATAAATRAKPSVSVIADLPHVTSNAYTERSADAAILSMRARGPAPSDPLETPRKMVGNEPASPSSAHDACNGGGFVARAVCMDRECERARFRDSAECSRILGVKRTREAR